MTTNGASAAPAQPREVVARDLSFLRAYARRVWTRRRFMFLLGGATTGLWFASTGIVQLDRTFVLRA